MAHVSLRVWPALALVTAVGLAWPGIAAGQVLGNAGDPVLQVAPTGIAPDDAANVQWALDNVASPGTVVLKAADLGGNPLAFNFGGTAIGNGAVIKLLRPDIVLTGEGWDEALDEPRTKIVGGGGPFLFSPSLAGQAQALVFAVRAPGVTIREIKLTTGFAYTGVYVVSTTEWPASNHAVRIVRNHIKPLNFAVLTLFTAAFPVEVEGNLLEGNGPVSAQWMGFTLRPITTETGFAYDEPVVPVTAAGRPRRYPYEITRNRIVKTPGSTAGITVLAAGWANYQNVPAGVTDPDQGCRRFRENATAPFVYQCVQGDNGPVLIAKNTIVTDSLGANAIMLGWGDAGVNHAVVWRNTVSGRANSGVWRYAYGHDTWILDNDFSRLEAAHHLVITAPGTIAAGNVLGAVRPLDKWPATVPQPAVQIGSLNFYPSNTPMPHPTSHCVLTLNDYRRTGITDGSILLASEAELQAYAGTYASTGTEVKHNLVFETGRFPRGTGGSENHVTVLDDLVNPETGMPYVHDNRIVGLPASGVSDPGIGQAVARVKALRKMLEARER